MGGRILRLTWSLVKGERFPVQAPLALGNPSPFAKGQVRHRVRPPKSCILSISCTEVLLWFSRVEYIGIDMVMLKNGKVEPHIGKV